MKRIFLLLILWSLVACKGGAVEPLSDEIIQTAIAQTLAAQTASAELQKETATPEQTLTSSPLPTHSPTETLIYGPTLQAIDVADCIPNNTTRESGMVIQITDGDTIVVRLENGDYRVRYIGMDTPEKDDNYGGKATNKNSELVAWQTVTLVKDVSETDQYDRLLRYVFVGDTFVNYELVREGFANVVTYPPDVACENTFREAERLARYSGSGLWKPTATPLPTSKPTLPPPPPTSKPTSPPPPPPPPKATKPPSKNCHPSYPTVCIPPPPPDLDCGQIPYRRFQVLPPDPHRFDGDHDGIGCESG